MHGTRLLKRSTQGFWDHMTFRSITSVMNCGLLKQLDFDDLLLLPTDMDPSTCHDKLLSCWQDQQNNPCSNVSLFRAMFSAYGWPYLRLGLLKVFLFFNECSRGHLEVLYALPIKNENRSLCVYTSLCYQNRWVLFLIYRVFFFR